MNIAIIIVTHNSEIFLEKNLRCLEAQKYKPSEVIIVDSASQSSHYLKELTLNFTINIKIILESTNVGFSRGNNIGLKNVNPDVDYVIFLNPDAFLPENFIVATTQIIEKYGVDILTGKLLGYDMNTDCPTGRIDSTGVFKTWYGRWYDRGQGEIDVGQYDSENLELVPAICGALLICKYSVIEHIISMRGYFFDESFFMHKEDIEVSLYVASMGIVSNYSSNLVAFHCRGWSRNSDRRKISRLLRLFAAKNDVKIAFRYSKLSIPFSILKYIGVKWFNA